MAQQRSAERREQHWEFLRRRAWNEPGSVDQEYLELNRRQAEEEPLEKEAANEWRRFQWQHRAAFRQWDRCIVKWPHNVVENLPPRSAPVQFAAGHNVKYRVMQALLEERAATRHNRRINSRRGGAITVQRPYNSLHDRADGESIWRFYWSDPQRVLI